MSEQVVPDPRNKTEEASSLRLPRALTGNSVRRNGPKSRAAATKQTEQQFFSLRAKGYTCETFM
jgi:hypothetical protein